MYGPDRDIKSDQKFISDKDPVHTYSIYSRIPLVGIPCWTIDPEGCTDADDGFSLVQVKGHLQLMIHIADPTHFIPLDSPLWKDTLKRTLTRYPSNHKPIHMLPEAIMEKASLVDNSEFGMSTKPAMTLIVRIGEGFQPLETQLQFTYVTVSKQTQYSYSGAADEVTKESYFGHVLNNCLLIAEVMRANRKTVGKKLSELSVTGFSYKNGVEIKSTPPRVQQIKDMIAEFAIYTNSFIGVHLQNMGIFRTCDTGDWLQNVSKTISSTDLMEKIVTEGISAEYLPSAMAHDLVGSTEYCHFTSPIRRVADCVCHYLVKYIYLTKSALITRTMQDQLAQQPFSKQELDNIATICLSESKKLRKIQFADIKFRTFQALSKLCSKGPIKITIKVTGYINSFLNAMITQIEDARVSVSYTLRIFNYKHVDYWNGLSPQVVTITKVNIPGKFDEGTLPELDTFLKQGNLNNN